MSWNFQYDSQSQIISILEREGLAMSKKFGQNFLLSQPIRERIVDAMEITPDSRVWEIGPGLGSITSIILERGSSLTSFEIDHGFCRILRDEAFGDENKFTLVEGDALKTWTKVYRDEGCPDVICGNLPYNVGSVCIAKFLEEKCHPNIMVYTLQKEVADRLCSKEGDKLYSAFTILAQIDYDVELLFTIKGGCFYPVPDVTSAVIKMTRRKESLVPESLRDDFLMIVRDLFAQRRKTIKNNLIHGKTCSFIGRENIASMIEKAGLQENLRAEVLGIDSLKRLAESYQEIRGN